MSESADHAATARTGARPMPATRTDLEGGFHEVLEFFGDGPDRLAGCTHIPSTEPRSGVVICSSLFNEFLKNYRREVALARWLARRGIAVQRFHYRGTGQSDGHPLETTFESMCDDAGAAIERLRQLAGVATPVLIGTRFGALVAARSAAPLDSAPVALVEPVLTAAGFFKEGLRNRLYAAGIKVMRDTPSEQAGPRTVDDLVAELEDAGSVDVLGYAIGADLYRSSIDHTLTGELGQRQRPVLAVQFGAGSIRRELASAATAWREQGLSVEIDSVGGREMWWLAEEREAAPGEVENRPQGLAEDDPLLGLLGDWIERQLVRRSEP